MLIKKKKKILIIFLIMVLSIICMQIVAGAFSDSATRVSYTICESGTRSFTSSYTSSFNCGEFDSTLSLKSTNNAATRANGVPSKTYYKEAYVGIKNSSGTWKTDTKNNSNLSTVGASVDPIAFTPIMSQHDIIIYETGGYKMHTRIYN